MTRKLSGKVALVTGGSRGIGAAISVALKEAGYSVAANYAGNDEAASKFSAETGIRTYKWSVADYDALVLPGGTVNPDKLRVDEDAVAFVRDFVESGKPVAAICHGPWTLIEAGVATGRTLTSFPSIRTDLRNAGAEVVDQDVVVDGNLIPSRSPDELPAFCDTLMVECASNSTQGEVLS